VSALFPFRALRPAEESASRVAAVPYDVVSTDEARALVAGNPVSFLRVTRAEVDLPSATNPYDEKVYEQALQNFEALKREAPMLLEPDASLYVYRLRMGRHEQIGVAGCFSLDEYEQGTIKKHEHTRKDKEDDRTRHILGLRAQTGIVFLTYRASADVDRVVDQIVSEKPLYDFVASDGVAHTVWRVCSEASARALVNAFATIPVLYIADGHHRAASAWRAARELNDARPGAESRRFVAVAFPDAQVQILPYNRVVRDLAGMTAETFLQTMARRLEVESGAAPTPSKSGTVSMYVSGRWYSLRLPIGGASGAPADRLDVAVLDREVLKPVLGIADVRTDKRIDFVGGARGTAELERRVDAGQAAIAFSFCPVSIDDLLAIADSGGIMPPKSTWFEPKLRDGLLVHLI
jgi:uncharacterized protein (DUF1015 family)